jgi:hypothetical protein
MLTESAIGSVGAFVPDRSKLLTKDRRTMIAGRSSPMINLTYEDRAELLAALVGAVLGIVGGYLSGNGWFIMVIWAIVFAIVASEGVRAFR